MAALKLIKLMYLADRESMDRYGLPISFDSPVSMDHGPILSRTLDLINGFIPSAKGGADWEAWIRGRDEYDVALARQFEGSDLDQLSEADRGVLEDVWSTFGWMDKWQISDYTHENCPEWENPQGSSMPIPVERILRALNKADEDVAALMEEINLERRLDKLFARA